jgi:hypothetical protein
VHCLQTTRYDPNVHIERCEAQVYIRSMSKRTETMTIRLSEEMKAELAKLAQSERRSASQMAVILLEEALEARQGKKG